MSAAAEDVTNRKPPRPFIMRGAPRVLGHRPTLADRPDRRVEEVRVPHLTAAQVRMLTRDKALDPRFRPVDRYLWRWSYGQGSGLPLEAEDADRLPESRPTPLPGDESIVTDLVVLHSPEWARTFVFMWFRSDATIDEIAARLQVRSRAVWDERKLVLAYYLGRLTEAGIRIPSWEPET